MRSPYSSLVNFAGGPALAGAIDGGLRVVDAVVDDRAAERNERLDVGVFTVSEVRVDAVLVADA